MTDFTGSPPRSWFEKISQAFGHEPRTLEELIQILRDAVKRQVLEQQVLGMIEGAIAVSELQARDVMVPASHLVLIQVNMPFPELLKTVIESGHSRFPVFGTDRDDILGILLAKDLLPYLSQYLNNGPSEAMDIKAYLRPPLYVPESKRVNSLLKEFRGGRNHLALVLDEYGEMAGLVTLEDVLEEIVGDISDEYDKNPASPFVRRKNNLSHTVECLMPIEAFNDHFQTHFPDDQFDTIGGWVLHHFGRVPMRGDKIKIAPLEFKVLSADSRRIRMVEVTPLQVPAGLGDT